MEPNHIEEDDDEGLADRAAAHARLNRATSGDIDADRIVQSIKERYGGRSTARLRDLQQVPQRLLVPSVSDPNLWQIKVKVRVYYTACKSKSDISCVRLEGSVILFTACSRKL